MTTDAECLVIGAGVMGAAASWALAREGRGVVLLEQFELGHRRGSSHGASRVFRFSYDHPMYVQMAMEALPLWRRLEEDAGKELYTELGGIDFGGDLRRNIDALRERGAAFEVLEAREAMRRFPAVRIPEDGTVLIQPNAGIVRADDSVRAFVQTAVSRGAEFRGHERVRRLTVVDDHSVEVETETTRYSARTAIVTAGAWARPLLATAGIDLAVTPSRETVAYFHHPDEMTLPILVDWGSPLIYALPDPGRGIKAGAHHTGPDTDPDEAGEVNAKTVEILSAWVEDRFPHADPNPHLAETCLYTNTADEHFVLERHGPIVVGSPCSGHGFKFAPLIGRRLADLATG